MHNKYVQEENDRIEGKNTDNSFNGDISAYTDLEQKNNMNRMNH